MRRTGSGSGRRAWVRRRGSRVPNPALSGIAGDGKARQQPRDLGNDVSQFLPPINLAGRRLHRGDGSAVPAQFLPPIRLAAPGQRRGSYETTGEEEPADAYGDDYGTRRESQFVVHRNRRRTRRPKAPAGRIRVRRPRRDALAAKRPSFSLRSTWPPPARGGARVRLQGNRWLARTTRPPRGWGIARRGPPPPPG